jgi:flagellar L-ring protein FlgH
MSHLLRIVLGCVMLTAVVASAQQSEPTRSGNGAQQGASNAQPAASSQQEPRDERGATTYEEAGGSLYRMENGASGGSRNPSAADSSLFTVKAPEPKRVAKWDLITVIVREESDSKSSASTETKKSADFNALLEQYIKLSMADFALKGRAPLENQPQLSAQAERNYKGEGTVDRSDSMSARVQAQVIDVKPNGVLVIQATKVIRNDEEEQKFVLTGMVRAEDVTIDNSVLSTQLADLMLEKNTRGTARDGSKKGFIPRMLDKLNPF